MPLSDPERSFGFLLNDVHRLLRTNFNRKVQPLGLTQAQWRTLAHLNRHPGISQVALADILEVKPITLARQIDRLEAAGWVERRPDPDDRRAFKLYTTEVARPLLTQLQEQGELTRAEAFAGITPAACEHLIDTLLAIRSNLVSVEAVSDPLTIKKKPTHG